MAECEANNDLLEEPKRLRLVQPSFVDQVLEQLSTRDVLHHQESKNKFYLVAKKKLARVGGKFIANQLLKRAHLVLIKFNLQLLFRFIDVIEADDMGVVDELHDGNLPLDPAVHGSTVDQGRLGDDLDGHLLVGLAVATQFDTPCGDR